MSLCLTSLCAAGIFASSSGGLPDVLCAVRGKATSSRRPGMDRLSPGPACVSSAV